MVLPPDLRDAFLEKLSSKHPEVSNSALGALENHLDDPWVLDAFLRLARASGDEAAALSDRAFEPLCALYQQQPKVRELVEAGLGHASGVRFNRAYQRLEQAVRNGDEEAADALVRNLGHPEDARRQPITKALTRAIESDTPKGVARRIESRLQEMFTSSEPHLQAQSIPLLELIASAELGSSGDVKADAGIGEPDAAAASARGAGLTEVNAAVDAVQAYIRVLLDKPDLEPPLSRFDRPALQAIDDDLEDFRDLVSCVDVGPDLLRHEAERLRRHTETYREHDDSDETRDLVGLLDTFLRGVAVILKGYEVVQSGG